MANIKVSEMTEATTFEDGNYTMILQNNQNKKISKENMFSNLENGISANASDITTINTNIGDLTNLETSDKTSIVNAINSIVDAEVYSTSEIKTNKVWIDGKPIYRKVISFTTTISANNLFTLAHNISNLSYYKITEATVKSESGLSYTLPMVGYGANTTDKLFCYMDGTNIHFYSNGSWGAIWTKYVTIEYTKTTD